jgi:hypothetical protein
MLKFNRFQQAQALSKTNTAMVLANQEPRAAFKTEVGQTAERIAAVMNDCDRLDAASLKLYAAKGKTEIASLVHMHVVERSRRLEHEIKVLEEAISISNPVTLADVLISLAVSMYRLDAIREGLEGDRASFARDCAILENTISRAIVTLEKLSGVSLAGLGLGGYFHSERSTDELLAAAKIEED